MNTQTHTDTAPGFQERFIVVRACPVQSLFNNRRDGLPGGAQAVAKVGLH